MNLPVWAVVALVIFWGAVLATAAMLVYRKAKGRTPSPRIEIPHAHELTGRDNNLSRQPGMGIGGP